MTENHPCHGCMQARMRFVSPSAKRSSPVCKVYPGIMTAKCADYRERQEPRKEN